MMTRTVRALALALLIAQGCSSGYNRAYERETQKLETQARADDARDKAQHAEASRYAAVVYFDTGSATIGQDGDRELSWFVEKMQPYPKAQILVQGFADSTGGEGTNKTLSEDRAKAVAAALSAKGIAAARMDVRGFGVDSPAATNVTAKGRNRNRRVEVTVR